MACPWCLRSKCGCGIVSKKWTCSDHDEPLVLCTLPLWKGAGTDNDPHRIIGWLELWRCPRQGCDYAKPVKRRVGSMTPLGIVFEIVSATAGRDARDLQVILLEVRSSDFLGTQVFRIAEDHPAFNGLIDLLGEDETRWAKQRLNALIDNDNLILSS
jgi:hypothetical protein